MLARLVGKSNIYAFKIEIFGDVKTFDFLKVDHHEWGDVLCQVINITRDHDKLIGDCKIIGYRESGVLKNVRTPFANDAQVDLAGDEFIEDVVGLNSKEDAVFGLLEHHPNLKITLDLKKAITKHIAILAKSGAGKSYTVGVLLEEVLKKNIPIVILDPHNEYASLKYPNSDKKDIKRLEKFKLKPEGFLGRVKEYSPDITINPQCQAITLDIATLRPQDLMDSLPQKLSPAQQNLLFNILSTYNNKVNFDELIFSISNEESGAKWSLITLLEQLKKLKIYSANPTPLYDIVKYKQCSIISLKGVEPYVQETFVAGLLKSLFEARKKDEIPPFLLVLEEAHNFAPERSFGELKTSKIVRTLAGEGRKFGIGLCVVSQRPAKVDKNVISQCSTQILLKITNPNDLKSVIASSEGVDSASEQEIQKLNIGTALLTGVIDIPLKVNVRPRISKHGGETVDITLPYEVENGNSKEEIVEEKNHFNENQESAKVEEEPKKEKESIVSQGEHSEYIQFIAPEIDPEDAKVMLDSKELEVQLTPATLFKIESAEGKEQTILMDRVGKTLIKTLFPFEGEIFPQNLASLSDAEKKLLKIILTLEDSFNPAELLIKSNVMFNEILRVCDSLASKSILKKVDKNFELDSAKVIKHLSKFSFFGNQKFEEVSYDVKVDEKISSNDAKKLLSSFVKVSSAKDIFLLKYVGK